MNNRRSVLVIALAAIAITVGIAATGSIASSARNGQIAWKSFAHAGSHTWSIYAANPDGSNIRQLTHPKAGVEDDLPDWAPDGSNILFQRILQPQAALPTVPDEIMRVNSDGSGLRRIGTCTTPCIGNDDPQYSPDGRRIVFTKPLLLKPNATPALGVWVMDANGGNARQITQLANSSSSEDHEPSWSPDGKSIVFTRLNDTAAPINEQALFVVGSNGGTPRRITPWRLDAGGANWSPKRSAILFQSYRDCSCTGTSQVYVIAPNGTGLKRLTSTGWNIEPNWSPDGTNVVYAHEPGTGPDGLPDLWTMDADGKHKAPLVQANRWDSEPDWGTAPTTH